MCSLNLFKTTYTQYLKTCIHFQERMSKFHIFSLSFIGLFYWIKDAVNFFKQLIFLKHPFLLYPRTNDVQVTPSIEY